MTDEPRGRLRDWCPSLARADGLQGVAAGDRVEIVGSGPALVTGLATDAVELAPLSSIPPAPGAAVYGAGPFEIDAHGRPNSKGPGTRLFAPPRRLLDHVERRRLTTGLLVYDLKQPIPLGSTVLALGDAPPVAQHLLRHQAAEGRIAIHARLACGPVEAGSRILTVEPGPDPTPAAVWLVPWSAMALASRFRDEGKDAVVVLDSLDRWRARINDFPWQGTWPTQLGRLLGSAWSGGRGSASLVALGPARYGPLLESSFDARLDLDRALRGVPAVGGSKLLRPPFPVEEVRRIGAAFAQLEELERWETSSPWLPLPGPLRAVLRLRDELRFRPGMSLDLRKQLAALLQVL